MKGSTEGKLGREARKARPREDRQEDRKLVIKLSNLVKKLVKKEGGN